MDIIQGNPVIFVPDNFRFMAGQYFALVFVSL